MTSPYDIIEITQVVNLYGHIIDAGAWERLHEVFSADATYDITSFGGGVMVGVAGIQDTFRRGPHPPAHHMSNVYVEQKNGEVRALSKLFGPDWQGRMQIGDYRDVMVKGPAGWRIQHRVAYLHRYWTGSRAAIEDG